MGMKTYHSLKIALTMGLMTGFTFAERTTNTTDSVQSKTNLSPIVVTATAISKYRTENILSTKLPCSPEKTPQVVDVMTEDYIRDRNPTDLDNLLSAYPGVFTGGKTVLSRTAGQYSLRGMSGSEVLLNGLVPFSSGMGTFMDPNVLERVEIPKGPVGSIIGGQMSSLGAYGAGGSINLYQKRPQMDPFITSEFRSALGEQLQRYRMTGDINEPIIDEKLLSRMPLTLEYNRPFWAPAGSEMGQSYTIAPTFLAQPTDDVRFGVDSMLSYRNMPAYQGISIYKGVPRPGYDWDSNPSLPGMRDEYLALTVLPYLEWDVTEDFTLKTGMGYSWNALEYNHIGPNSGIPTVAKPYEVCAGDTIAQRYSAYLQGNYTLETDPVTQTFIAGTDYTCKDQYGKSSFMATNKLTYLTLTDSMYTRSTVVRYGSFIHDAVEFYDLALVFGTRYDYHLSSEGNAGGAFSPRAGLSYAVTDWLIPFANWSYSSAPNFGFYDASKNELTDSWTAEQAEGGIRIAPNKDFWFTISAFKIWQDNTPLTMGSGPTAYTISDGETVSQGIEFSATGNILPNWSIHAAYTAIDFENKSSTNKFDSFPPQSVSCFTTYKIDAAWFRGWVAGFGYRYRMGFDQTLQGRYQGEDYFVEGYHVFDTSLEIPVPKRWHLGDSSLMLGVKNIFDKRYVESARNMQCFVGDPRTFELGFRTRF